MKHAKILGLAAALLAVPAAHAASPVTKSGLNYDYLDVGLRISDYDGPDGLGVGGTFSYDLGQVPRLRLLGSVSFDDLDEPDGYYRNLMIGAGYIHPLAAKTDLVADVSILYSAWKLDVSGSPDDRDVGVRVSGYVRHELQQHFQVEGGLNLVNIFDDTDLGLNLGGYYEIAQNVWAMVRYDQESDVDTVTLGARLDF